jgi:uncharacterized Zn-binding protein involved in type VI secretion
VATHHVNGLAHGRSARASYVAYCALAVNTPTRPSLAKQGRQNECAFSARISFSPAPAAETLISMKPIVRKGDATDHGGTVLDGFVTSTLNGRPAAGVGHMVLCPQCKGNFAIVQGSSQYVIDGRGVALDDMKTACGASLIASQQGFLASE